MAAKISTVSTILMLSFLLFACSKEPADGPEVKVGADGVSVTFDADDLAKLTTSLKNLAAVVHQIKQLAPPAGPDAKPPGPPSGAPKPPPGLPGPPSGAPKPPAGPPGPPGGAPSLPGVGAKPPAPSAPGALPGAGGPPSGPPEIPQELRNRMGLEVESLLGFLEDPDTPIPGKDHLHRIVDLTTSGTGQFSAQELDELESEVQAMLGEIGDSGSGMGVGGAVPVPVPGPGGPGPGGPGPAPGGPAPGGPPGPGPGPPGP